MKKYLAVPTTNNLNIRAFKWYIACFNVCLYKRYITVHRKMVSDIMGHIVFKANTAVKQPNGFTTFVFFVFSNSPRSKL